MADHPSRHDPVSDLEGRVALVTGGLGGIGRACVDALRTRGARVAFTYAEGVERPEDAEDRVRAHPQQMSAHPLDLNRHGSIRDCLRDVQSRWEAIDILVNNAAVGSATVAAYAEEPEAQDAAMLRINADGTLRMCMAFLALPRSTLHADPQKIVNIASVGGGIGVFPGFRLSDGMSKAAVAFLTRQLAAEYVHRAVDIVAVCPGATRTPMLQRSTLDQMSEARRAEFIAALPRGRLIEPEEIARLIVFLCTPAASVLHGAVLDASMGLGVRPGLMTEFGH